MPTIDYATRLTAVQAAIASILSGGAQSVTYDGMSVTKLDLPMLMREESRLVAKVNRATRTGGAFKSASPR